MRLAEELTKFADDKILYVKTEPEITNFTAVFTGNLVVHGRGKTLTATFPAKDDTLNFFHQLKTLLADKTVIFWNVKNIVSYLKFHLPRADISFPAKIADLKLIEAFLGIKLPPPASLPDVMKRLEPYVSSDDCKKIHKDIHKPLALKVVPAMETTGVLDTELRRRVYPSYEIEAQTFGRMSSHKEFENCITPHNMGDDRKAVLKPKGEKDFFVNFDFRHMEVSMLQWISGDMALKKELEAHDDIYKGIYGTVIGQPCDSEAKRDFIKGVFLPTMFGLQPQGLVDGMSERGINLSFSSAYQIQQTIKTKYKTAWDYLSSHQEMVKNTPVFKDRFGRPRYFADKPLSVRAFLVQSSSAVVCLEKLIGLHEKISQYGHLIYSIHDGYWLSAHQDHLIDLVRSGLRYLQECSKMCEGLGLKVSCSVGKNMTEMKAIPTKG